jgi:hypothetical protein
MPQKQINNNKFTFFWEGQTKMSLLLSNGLRAFRCLLYEESNANCEIKVAKYKPSSILTSIHNMIPYKLYYLPKATEGKYGSCNWPIS